MAETAQEGLVLDAETSNNGSHTMPVEEDTPASRSEFISLRADINRLLRHLERQTPDNDDDMRSYVSETQSA